MAQEKVFDEELKGGKLTGPALASIERRYLTGELYPDASRLTVKDTDIRGLELRLSRKGGRSWAVSRRVHGQQRRFTIADSAGFSLSEARQAALLMKAEIAKGADPVAERREKRQAVAEAKRQSSSPTTLREIIEEFERVVAKPKAQKSWPDRRRLLEREYKEHLDHPAARLTAAHVRRTLDAAAGRGSPVSGWHGFRYLRRVMAWAARRGLVPADPTAGIPREEVHDTVGREGQRDRVLSPNELRAVWRALEALPGSRYAAMYKLILLTGQRPNEVAGMRWADLDLDRAEWVQTDNKSSRRHVVPLSSDALAILQRCPRGMTHVFPTRDDRALGARTGNWHSFTQSVSAAAGVTGWSRHDLRRTAATIMAELKVERTVIELLLNHSERAAKGGTVASIYNRHSYTMEKRQAVEKLAERVRAIVSGELGEVIEIRPANAG